MKWVKLVLVVLILAVGIPSPLLADTSADITVTVVGLVVDRPGSFTVFYISDYEVGITWQKPANAVNTLIRGAVGRYPEDRNDGYLVYYGDGEIASDKGVSLDETLAAVYYRGWSQRADGLWSNFWAEDQIEGEGVREVALAMTQLSLAATLGLQVIPLILFTVLAFWRAQPILFILAGALALMMGLHWFDQHDSTVGMAISLTMIAYALLCMGYAFRYIFWGRQDREE